MIGIKLYKNLLKAKKTHVANGIYRIMLLDLYDQPPSKIKVYRIEQLNNLPGISIGGGTGYEESLKEARELLKKLKDLKKKSNKIVNVRSIQQWMDHYKDLEDLPYSQRNFAIRKLEILSKKKGTRS